MRIEQMPMVAALGMSDVRFSVPVFQRVYSWTARQCEELWEDAMHSGATGKTHFAGMLLVTRDAEGWRGLERLDVIDGQQRLTTLMLLLAALHGHVESEVCAGVPSADVIADRYLLADEGVSAKLALTGLDRDTLAALVGAAKPPEIAAQRLIDNYLLFAGKMEEPSFDAAMLWRGLSLLDIVLVKLDAADGPQTVFESLNSKGMPLSIADRVRNLIVASTDEDEQERLFCDVWFPLEEQVAASGLPATLDDVLCSWLAQRYRNVRILDEGEVYGVFKMRLRDEYAGSLVALLGDVGIYLDRFISDAGFRERAKKNAEAWMAGKPEKSVSEFKLFGD